MRSVASSLIFVIDSASNMRNFNGINRLMGTAQEQYHQGQNGDFDDRLDVMLNRVDPYWEQREKTEMDIFYTKSPVHVIETEDGWEVTYFPTTRTGAEEFTPVLVSQLIPREDTEAEGPELEPIS